MDGDGGRRATRRELLAGGAGLAGGLVLATAAAGQAGVADFLFVQTARELAYDAAEARLTLGGVSPVTLFFSDRPERIAGNMRTAAFVPFWSEGADSFLSDPPNADLSFLDGGALHQVVVVLRDPVLDGERLRYTVEILQGEMPRTAAEVSLFIDVIGMPLTPVSFAGAGRRAYRRAALY